MASVLNVAGMGAPVEALSSNVGLSEAPCNAGAQAPTTLHLPRNDVANHVHSETGPETIQPLPPPPANLAGSSSATGKNYEVTVSNKAGYLCHVHVETRWPVPPEVPFAIFTHPDNSALFRDVKRVGARTVLKTEPGYKEVQVEQLGDIQVLWIHRTYCTWLHVVEDSRDPECLRITFDLVRSDVLGKFSGRWELRPIRDPVSGLVVGCRGQLNQDVLPKGMPSFMARLPVLGGVLRGISVGAVTRVLEDFEVAMEKVRTGHAAGRSTEAVLRELCGAVSEVAHANGTVKSFAFDDDNDDAAEEEEEVDKGGGDGAEGTKQSECNSQGATEALSAHSSKTGGLPATEGLQRVVEPGKVTEEQVSPNSGLGPNGAAEAAVEGVIPVTVAASAVAER